MSAYDYMRKFMLQRKFAEGKNRMVEAITPQDEKQWEDMWLQLDLALTGNNKARMRSKYATLTQWVGEDVGYPSDAEYLSDGGYTRIYPRTKYDPVKVRLEVNPTGSTSGRERVMAAWESSEVRKIVRAMEDLMARKIDELIAEESG